MHEDRMRPDVRRHLDHLAASHTPGVDRLDPSQARERAIAALADEDLPVGEIATTVDLSIPGPAGPLSARLFDARPQRGPGPVVVWFHGGGFVTGGIETHQGLCAEVARQMDLPVVLVAYRLAPEAPFPAAPDDAEATARWVAGSPGALGRTVTGVVLAGDSAGGTLSIVTAMALRDHPAPVPVHAHLAFYPSSDATHPYPSLEEFAEGCLVTQAAVQWYAGHYRAIPTDIRASPLLGDLAGMPPGVIVTAGLDPLRDQGRAYAAGLVSAGVPTVFREAAGSVHSFVLLRGAVPSARADVAHALAALRHAVDEATGAPPGHDPVRG